MHRHDPRRRRLLGHLLASPAVLPGATALGAGLLGTAPAARAQAAAYPSRPITLVVGYPPGGSTDLTARIVAPALARALGQNVVIENVGGAGGVLGAQKVANAAPDGMTLICGANGEMAVSKLINPGLRFDPLQDFTPIGYIGSQPMLFVASQASGMRDLPAFIAHAKSHPGRLSYGSSGIGSVLHLAGEMIKREAGVFVVHIPYRGVGPLTTDLLSGQLELGMFVLSSGLPHVRSGKVTALGITERVRSTLAPDIPAVAEHPATQGVDLSAWYGIWAPKGLDATTTQRLRSAVTEAIADPEVRARLQAAGTSLPEGERDLASFQRSEMEKYRRLVAFAKIKQ